jgi:hypothetical protein
VPDRLRPLACLAGAALAGMLASCSANAPNVPVTHPAAGHGSPAAATAGFFQRLAAGDKAACTYVIPDDGPLCMLAVQAATVKLTGFGVGEVTIGGSEALVSVVGRLCVTEGSSTTCSTNSDDTIGQPAGGSPKAFASLYRAATAGVAIAKGAIPCEEEKGKWYVSLLG